MISRALLVGVFIFALPVARAETWRTLGGESWEGKLTGVYGPFAIFSEKTGSRQVAVEGLDDAALGRVADFLSARAGAKPWGASDSPVAKALRNRLQVLQGEKLAAFDPGARAEPEIYLAYFGALWCGPCVRFSPALVNSYEQLKLAVRDRIELVFVSSDRDSGEQLNYVRKVRMPWPVVKFSSLGSVKPIERWAGNGIPCLVALTREGDVLFHSYRGNEYLGPQHVLNQVTGLLQAMAGDSSVAKRSLHRLAVIQHVRAAADGRAAAKPYVISMDPRRFQTLETKELVAALEIDAQGRVASASFTPKLDAVVEYQLVENAQTWLFLPTVVDGQPRAQRVQLPLKL